MIEWISLIVGLFLLVKSSDLLIDGAVSLSKKIGISTLVIGLTVVAFGTSLPEFFVNIFATLVGNGQISIGNIVGSNIVNITLILGVGLLLNTVKFKESTVFREIPYAFFASFLIFSILGLDLIDGIKPMISRAWGIMFLTLFIFFLYNMYKSAMGEEKVEKEKSKHGYLGIMLLLISGIIGLYFGGEWTVNGAIGVARDLGVSTYLISALIIAFGTSLPELITTIRASYRGEVNLLVGNLVGSNIFNVFWVLGFTSLIRPINIPIFSLTDMFILVLVSYLLFLINYKRKKVGFKTGLFLIVVYALYFSLVVMRR